MDKQQQQRQDCRLASRIERQLAAGRKEWLNKVASRSSSFGDCAAELSSLSGHMAQFDLFPAVARSLRDRMRRLVAGMVEDLQSLQGILENRQHALTFTELLAELGQIRGDFGSFTYNAKQGILSVETDAIELEDQYLGPFDIHLDIRSLGHADPRHIYKVEASDPHPASGESGVTHPHVSDDHLCEGEASLPIRNALQAGRLGDFFTLVDRVLNTYNGASAYVALDRWEGSSCLDCGDHIRRDEGYSCERCDQEFCGDCSYTCIECERTVCRQCSIRCSGCDDRLCAGCDTGCSECGDQFCSKCLKDGLCEGCREAKEKKDDLEQQQEEQPAEVA
jgi:hypothetical protein